MSGEAKQCQEFLSKKCVADILIDKVTAEGFKQFDIVGVPEHYTVGETLTLFANNGIISAPIYKGRSPRHIQKDEPAEVLGLLNMMDILIAVTKPLYKRFGQSGLLPNDPQLSNDQLRNELESCSVLKHSVCEALGLSKESASWNPLKLTDSLDTLISKFSEGTHRVLVMASDEQEVQQLLRSHQCPPEAAQAIHRPHFISQFDCIRFLNNHAKGLDEFLSKTVHDLDKFGKAASDQSSSRFLRVSPSDEELGSHAGQQKTILTCSAQHTALSAFHLLYKNAANMRVSALPIVEAGSNKMIASLSASDLRGMTPAKLSTLLLPVVDYLAQLPPESHPFQPVLACLPSDSMSVVLQKLVNHHIHRVWIVEPSTRQADVVDVSDQDQRGRRKSGVRERPSVIGVISGTDILASMKTCAAAV